MIMIKIKIALLLTLFLMFTSCSDNDDEMVIQATKDDFIGEWTITDYFIRLEASVLDQLVNVDIPVVNIKDGKVIFTEFKYELDFFPEADSTIEPNDNSVSSDSWKVEGNILSIPTLYTSFIEDKSIVPKEEGNQDFTITYLSSNRIEFFLVKEMEKDGNDISYTIKYIIER